MSAIKVLAVLAALGCVVVGSCGTTLHESHWPNGNLRVSYHEDSAGRLHGVKREYYEDGTMQAEMHFSHGLWTEIRYYWPNGNLCESASAGSNGEMRIHFDENGIRINRE